MAAFPKPCQMPTFIVLVIIVFLLYLYAIRKKPADKGGIEPTPHAKPASKSLSKPSPQPPTGPTFAIIKTTVAADTPEKNTTSTPISEELKNQIAGTIKALTIEKEIKDYSVIDINNQNFQTSIPASEPHIMPTTVPDWPHTYVYSYDELLRATTEQKTFYAQFKYRFLKYQFLDLKGNFNYAFILLFDFLNEYEQNKNLLLLKSNLQELGKHYPKTQPYAMRFLAEKTRKAVGLDRPNSPPINQAPIYSNTSSANDSSYYFDATYWGLGTRYKTKLDLKEEDIILLNKLSNTSNNFTEIEFCCKETIKLFLALINKLRGNNFQPGESFEKQLDSLAGLVAMKHYRYRLNGTNYKHALDPIKNEIYTTVYKHCENTIREKYSHKRKLNTDWQFTHKEVIDALEAKIILPSAALLSALTDTIQVPDEDTDIKLYTQNTTRWKVKLDALTVAFTGNTTNFVKDVLYLGKLNQKNPSVENIFYEASKFISKTDKEAAVELYIHYLYHDLQSENFDNKQLAKSIQKSLFKTAEQLNSFEKLVTAFINNKDLTKALEAVKDIYRVKRKKIQLDNTLITAVEQQHAGTVELLNEFLNDELPETSNLLVITSNVNTSELQLEISNNTDTPKPSPYLAELPFTIQQMDVLELFVKHNLSLPQEELESFARNKKIFARPLITSINEICFEILDDILIEEEDIYLTINPDYYQTILL